MIQPAEHRPIARLHAQNVVNRYRSQVLAMFNCQRGLMGAAWRVKAEFASMRCTMARRSWSQICYHMRHSYLQRWHATRASLNCEL